MKRNDDGKEKQTPVPHHCKSHGAVHMSDWCSVPDEDKTALEATTEAEAIEECRRRGLWLYSDCLPE